MVFVLAHFMKNENIYNLLLLVYSALLKWGIPGDNVFDCNTQVKFEFRQQSFNCGLGWIYGV
jgi:hypothetical protein